MNARRMRGLVLFAAVVLSPVAFAQPAREQTHLAGDYPHEYEVGAILVTFRPETSNEHRLISHERARGTAWAVVTDDLPQLFRVRVPEGDEESAVQRHRRQGAVLHARKNWACYAAGRARRSTRLLMPPWSVEHSQAPRLWDITEPGEADGGIRGGLVRAAVIDSGLTRGDDAHEDLPKPIEQVNFWDPPALPVDALGHGTIVSGFLLARENELCLIGAAPSAELVIVKVLHDGFTTLDRMIQAIAWVRKVCIKDSAEVMRQSVRVVNMSVFRSTLPDPDEELECNRALGAGIVMTIAGGNQEVPSCGTHLQQYPAAYASNLVVGMVDENDSRTIEVESSRYPEVDLCAGGYLVPSLDPETTDECGSIISGASFASPVVAGVAALLFDAIEADSSGERTPAIGFLVRQALILGATDFEGGACEDPPGRDLSCGWGLVNAVETHAIVMRRLACPADYNLDGQLTSADLAEFHADYASATPVPGPAGYAVPAVITMLEPSDPRPPAPYDELGYKVDFDQDGTITPADLADFITAYFSGC